jgi:hypothetical protein
MEAMTEKAEIAKKMEGKEKDGTGLQARGRQDDKQGLWSTGLACWMTYKPWSSLWFQQQPEVLTGQRCRDSCTSSTKATAPSTSSMAS